MKKVLYLFTQNAKEQTLTERVLLHAMKREQYENIISDNRLLYQAANWKYSKFSFQY